MCAFVVYSERGAVWRRGCQAAELPVGAGMRASAVTTGGASAAALSLACGPHV